MSQLPPSTRDNWSYSGDFHVEASGHNRHRRATVPELKAIFDGTDSTKDRPAHWYEAQLIHYGLPPSKTKGTAKMRLFDAVGKGNLAVPAHILKVEADLKKDWNKRDREAKQALKKASTPATTTKVTGKRKADDSQVGTPGHNVSINLSVSFGPNGNFQVVPTEPAPKRAKATPTAKKLTPATKKTTPAAKKTKAAAPPVPKPSTSSSTTTTKKQTARRGTSRAGAAAARTTSSRPAAPPAPAATTAPRAPRTKQTARRSRPFNPATAPGRSAPANPPQSLVDTTPTYWDDQEDDDDAPPPYPGSPDYGGGYMGYDDSHDDGDGDGGYDDDGDGYGGTMGYQPSSPPPPLPPLGLLNGRYHVRCTAPLMYAESDHTTSGLIFTLDGNALWAFFEIGPLSGILRLDERPWESSHQELPIQWRARDDQGRQSHEHGYGGFVRFLGDGEIDGEIICVGGTLKFLGRRVSGQGTRSEVSSVSMRRQWDELWC